MGCGPASHDCGATSETWRLPSPMPASCPTPPTSAPCPLRYGHHASHDVASQNVGIVPPTMSALCLPRCQNHASHNVSIVPTTNCSTQVYHRSMHVSSTHDLSPSLLLRQGREHCAEYHDKQRITISQMQSQSQPVYLHLPIYIESTNCIPRTMATCCAKSFTIDITLVYMDPGGPRPFFGFKEADILLVGYTTRRMWLTPPWS